MLKRLDKILTMFEDVFNRKASFHWFVIILLGLVVREDTLGLTAIIRALTLCPSQYENMLKFFRANSWEVKNLQKRWCQVILQYTIPLVIDNHVVLAGDTTKVSKEAIKMPGVKIHYQSSEISSKPEHIKGHHLGIVGVVGGNNEKQSCIPIAVEIQEGIDELRYPEKQSQDKENLNTKMIDLAARVAKDLARPAVLVLDAYYSNSTVFSRASQDKDGEGNQLLHIVTRAKKNCVGFEDPLLKSPGPGRPRKYGEEIKLNELFVTAKDKFKKAEVMLYGKKSKVSYYSVDLIWRPIKSKIRFVLVEYQGNKIILMSSNLEFAPLTIIQLIWT